MTSIKTLNHKEFRAPIGTPVFVNVYFVIKTLPARFAGVPRFGVVSSKKVFRYAYQRNRARRLLREWIVFNAEHFVPEFDYIVIARAQILECDREMGRKLMRAAIVKVEKNQPDATTTE